MEPSEKAKALLAQKENQESWRLVLGGGGAKGCYHVGAWQAFDELGIHFTGVTGTSIGALVGIFYPGGRIGPVTRFVMEMQPTEIAKELPALPNNLKETVHGTRTVLEFVLKYIDSKMDITPLREHFREMFDYEAFAASPVSYACMTYDDTLHEGRPFYKNEITRENAEDVVMASAACYPAFPKVTIEGQTYMDGGYADNVPIALALEIMPDAAGTVVIDLHDTYDPLPPALTPEMFYMQPLLNPGNSLDFSTAHAKRLYNQGYLEANKYLDILPGHLFTFTASDADLIRVTERYLEKQLAQHHIDLPDRADPGIYCQSALLGYRPRALDNNFCKDYRYGELVEALALLARMEPVALYDYRWWLKTMITRLQALKVSDIDDDNYRMIETFSNLKREELPVRLHHLLVKNQGVFPAAVEKIKNRIIVSYTLAYIWYFMEELVVNLPAEETKAPGSPEEQRRTFEKMRQEAAETVRRELDRFDPSRLLSFLKNEEGKIKKGQPASGGENDQKPAGGKHQAEALAEQTEKQNQTQ